MKIKAIKDTWFIIDGEIKHKGKLEKGKSIETILPVRTFETEEEWKTELEKLGLSEKPKGFELPKINNN